MSGSDKVATDDGALRVRWVFDSAWDVEPSFPIPDRPRGVINGLGIRVTASRPVFDAAAVTLFDPIDERFFAYLLPLSQTKALVESTLFDSVARDVGQRPLLRYLEARYPGAECAATYSDIPCASTLVRTRMR